jgi:hypothetical protein
VFVIPPIVIVTAVPGLTYVEKAYVSVFDASMIVPFVGTELLVEVTEVTVGEPDVPAGTLIVNPVSDAPLTVVKL